jgi:hypothetical protein
MFKASRGVPPLVVAVVASLMVTVMLTRSPAFKVLFCMPLAEVMATLMMVGEMLSGVPGDTGVPAPPDELPLPPPLPTTAPPIPMTAGTT